MSAKVRNEIDRKFQMGFDCAYASVVGYHTDERNMLVQENWPTITELVKNIVENGVEEICIPDSVSEEYDFRRGLICFSGALQAEIFHYMSENRIFDRNFIEVHLVKTP